MRSEGNPIRGPLVTAGEFFLDLIFYNLDRLPALGEELKTDAFFFSLGGGAAITAAAAASLGRTSRLITIFGDSALDVEVQQRLRALGIDTRWSQTVSNTTSGLTVAVSTREDRYFLTYPGANRNIEKHILSEEVSTCFREAAHVHFALTPGDWRPFHHLVRNLKTMGISTSWDLGWDPAAAENPGFRELWRDLDLLFLNEMEALRYSRSDRIEEALEKLSGGNNVIVIKLGRLGSVALNNRSGPIRSPAAPVEARETTGAGDAFNGGFLFRWLESASLEECLQGGNICGALSTRSAGGVASLPSKEEFMATLQRTYPVA